MSEMNVESNLERELSALSDTFSELGERLLSAARQLHAPGAPPPESLLEEIAASRRDFVAIRERVQNAAAAQGLRPENSEALESLRGISILIGEVAEAEQRKAHGEDAKRRALEVLERVGLLSHASTPDFAPLKELQGRTLTLRQTIEAASSTVPPPEVEKLANGEDPLVELLVLVEERDTLDDERWASLHEAVCSAFGRPLAAAAARAMLVLPPGLEPRGQRANTEPGQRRSLGKATPIAS
jgi:hypothetical protein